MCCILSAYGKWSESNFCVLLIFSVRIGKPDALLGPAELTMDLEAMGMATFLVVKRRRTPSNSE